MAKSKKKSNIPFAGILIWLGIIVLASISCKSPTSPEEILQVNITVRNECGVAVDIYMDGNFQFSVEYLSSNTIQNVPLGSHELEAKKKGTETVLSYLSVEIFENLNFVWTILSEASLHISNEYEETLSIYGDGDLLDEIDSPGTLIIQNIFYGEHSFEARRSSDSTVVASTTINFDENKAYFWTISK